MESEKIYVNQDGMRPADIMAMLNNRGEGSFGDNGLLWLFLLLLNRGGLGMGNQGQEAFDTNVLLRAIDGNNAAISQLAHTFNCDINQVNQALCSIKGGIDKLSGELGYTSERIINAVQHGNCEITSKLQECCCSINLAISNQTNAMQIGFTTIGNALSKGFCDIAYAAQANTNAIIQSGNANTQRIVDMMTAQQMSEKDNVIAQLQQEKQTAIILAGIGKKD